MTKAPSLEELSELKKFVETQQSTLPQSTVDVLLRLLGVYSGFLQSASRAKNTLSRLREAMGLTAKSERGGRAGSGVGEQTTLEVDNLSPAQKEILAELQKKRAITLKEKIDYDKKIRSFIPKPKVAEQLEFALSSEMMFSELASHRAAEV